MVLDDPLHDCQSEAEAGRLFREEGKEYLAQIFLRDARAGIGNGYFHPVFPLCGRHRQSPAIRHRLNRIHTQIDQHLNQLVFIGPQRRRRFDEGQTQGHVSLFRLFREHLGHVAEHLVEFQFGRFRRLEAGVADELLQHAAHSEHFAVDQGHAIQEVALPRPTGGGMALAAAAKRLFDQLQVHRQGVERGADFVIHAGGDLSQHGHFLQAQQFAISRLQFLGTRLNLALQFTIEGDEVFLMRLEPLGHAIEGLVELADLGFGVATDPDIHIPVGEPLGRGRESQDRFDDIVGMETVAEIDQNQAGQREQQIEIDDQRHALAVFFDFAGDDAEMDPVDLAGLRRDVLDVLVHHLVHQDVGHGVQALRPLGILGCQPQGLEVIP